MRVNEDRSEENEVREYGVPFLFRHRPLRRWPRRAYLPNPLRGATDGESVGNVCVRCRLFRCEFTVPLQIAGVASKRREKYEESGREGTEEDEQSARTKEVDEIV